MILAVRNEQKYIRKCLDSLINQNYPKEKYEIIIIDGLSSDNTRIILNEYKTNYESLIEIYENPKMIRAAGNNIGISHSNGKIVILFIAHAYAHDDYLRNISEAFERSGKGIAGIGTNIFIPDDESFYGKVIANAQITLLGGGGTGFRRFRNDQIINSPGFPAYKKEIIEKVNMLDEEFETGEDTELNWRIRRLGYKFMVSSKSIVYYYRRHNSPVALFKRLFNYGKGRALVNKKHPNSFDTLTAIPAFLVIALSLLPLEYLFFRPLYNIAVFGFIIYLFAIIISSVKISLLQKNPKYFI